MMRPAPQRVVRTLSGFFFFKLTFWVFSFFFLRFYLFLEREKKGEREGEKHQCVAASCTPLTRDLAHNPDVCPDWESNQRPFGSQAGTQPTEPGHILGIFYVLSTILNALHVAC